MSTTPKRGQESVILNHSMSPLKLRLLIFHFGLNAYACTFCIRCPKLDLWTFLGFLEDVAPPLQKAASVLTLLGAELEDVALVDH